MAEVHLSTAADRWPEAVRLVNNRLACGVRGVNLIATQDEAHVTCQHCREHLHRARSGDCLCRQPVGDHFDEDNRMRGCLYAKRRNGHLGGDIAAIADAIRAGAAL